MVTTSGGKGRQQSSSARIVLSTREELFVCFGGGTALEEAGAEGTASTIVRVVKTRWD